MKAIVYILISSILLLGAPMKSGAESVLPQEHPSFKDVKVREIKGRFTVTGQARVSSGSFYYMVEDGHRVLLSETLLKVNKEAPAWTEFSIILPELKRRNGKLFLNLYERDEGDGKIIHSYLVVLPNK
ncbi:Gmad2 immunoglobulin-like domain-containing protein [Rossellomorea vietnamensis]|uniref:Gmad2 immunoglobulin-like domain-containing protein n=1 Tax=Rossellomorea vietnamensis TaxID=218284 RepID=A0ACD4CBF2_9BACI|nr:Gmad2 immunoglobulin-like domain-containing protein [Rossellomorea vietnamensis]UXH45751.1 Gmad2 immunoglobulin-like domain-containing protein [Rossellomorea vietnamensis]